MALFGDDNKKTIEELESYYSNKTQRTGMAWAMAFLSLLITVVVLGSLFFGGRWLYRTLSDDPETPVASTSETEETDDSTNTGSVIGNLGLSINGSQTEGVVSEEAASTSTPNTGISVDNSEGTDTDTTVAVTDGSEVNGEDTAVAETATEENGEVAGATTEDSSEALPDTGAGSLLIAAPLVTLVLGYTAAIKRQISRL